MYQIVFWKTVLLFLSERLEKGTYHILKEGDKDFSISYCLLFILVKSSAVLSECTKEALRHWSSEARLNVSTCSEFFLPCL